MQCVQAIKFNILLSDANIYSFFLSCGLRLDGPLSPYLLLLSIEFVSKLLQKSKVNGLSYGIKIAKHALSISHLLYVDDSFCIFDAANSNTNTLKSILVKFNEALS